MALTVRGSLQANQSLVSVGNKPMLQHLYSPNTIPANWHKTNTVLGSSKLCPGDESLSNAVSNQQESKQKHTGKGVCQVEDSGTVYASRLSGLFGIEGAYRCS